MRLDVAAGRVPSLYFAPDGSLLAYYSDALDDGGTARALFQTVLAPGSSTLGPRTQVIGDGGRVAVRFGAGGWELAAAGTTGFNVLASPVGGTAWATAGWFVSTNGLCPDPERSHALFADGPDGPELAFEYLYDTGIYGCVNRTWLMTRAAAGWPHAGTAAGEGAPAGLWPGATETLIVTSSGVLTSPGPGQPFTLASGGSQTNTRLGGTGAASDALGNLYVVQPYSWSSQYELALLTGDATGVTWRRRVLATNPRVIEDALVAVDGALVSVAFRAATSSATLNSSYKEDVFIVRSGDGGQTWTSPTQLSHTAADRTAIDVALAAVGGRVAVAWGETTGTASWGYAGVYLALDP